MSEEKSKQLFQNGTEVIFATTPKGPSLYSVLEGAWMLPALLSGIRSKIWEAYIDTKSPIAGVWFKLGLFAPVYEEGNPEPKVVALQLSEAGERLVACADLLEYEFSMMEQQLSGELNTDPAKYEKLRGGLAAYASNYLPELTDWVCEHVKVGSTMLDFCGGSGHYLVNALENQPTATGVLFDKAPGLSYDGMAPMLSSRLAIIEGDVKTGHPLFNAQAGTYDVVLMSEILHCMSPEEREAAIENCFNMLKVGGWLLVIEQYPNMRLDWRLFDMTESGTCIGQDQMAYEVQKQALKPAGVIDSVSHYGISFVKMLEDE